MKRMQIEVKDPATGALLQLNAKVFAWHKSILSSK
ncbi:MAG: hypothetical protein JWR05_2919 [Mucilaginibacter sp.]|nr:hypothetical protein [Mucilaginibacter sp.]